MAHKNKIKASTACAPYVQAIASLSADSPSARFEFPDLISVTRERSRIYRYLRTHDPHGHIGGMVEICVFPAVPQYRRVNGQKIRLSAAERQAEGERVLQGAPWTLVLKLIPEAREKMLDTVSHP